MPHLVSISLGPVQDFIASARRFRDLWFGSWLLSELSKAAALGLARQTDTRLIFPAPETERDLTPGSALVVANKILAEVAGDPRAAVAAAERLARERLAEIADEVLAELAFPELDAATARAQVADLLEWHWAAVPCGGDYPTERRRVETLLAARKNTREFGPVTWGRDLPKSSLDGQREAVIDPASLTRRPERSLFRRYGLRPGENLCGVGLLKRHGGDPLAVPSTAHMAALGALEGADPARVSVAVPGLVAALAGLGLAPGDFRRAQSHPILGTLHGQVLFANRLEDMLASDREKLGPARAAVRAFLDNAGLPRPHPYYAVLVADGDRLGATLDAQPDPEVHRALTRALAAYASHAAGVVSANDGFAVYAGGDDVLALVPLHTAVACARALADAFTAALASRGVAATMSVGVAVGHQLEPADQTLARARRAEKLAKRQRNALGLIVKKRGGVEQELCGSWNELDARLDEWVAMHREGRVPDGAAYELRELARALGPHGPAGAFQAETARILGRKRVGGGAAVAELDQDRIVARATSHDALEHLAEELVAARLFADPWER